MSNIVLDAIRERRTVRKFTDEPVTDEEIRALLDAAMSAPSRLNRRPWHFVVIRDHALLRQLAAALRIHPYLEKASAVIAVCASPGVSPTWTMDASAAIENMLIGATSLGLGTAWVGAPDTVMWNLCEELLRDSLGIPVDIRIPALIAVGRPEPGADPQPRASRYDETRVHFGGWDRRGL